MNVITVAGQLGKDAELKTINSGEVVCSFSVADSMGRDKPTIWWNCQMWGKRAEAVSPYLLKGQAVTVSGTVSERTWKDKDGNERKSMDVRVNDVALQGAKKEAAQPERAQPPKRGGGGASLDDEIPFRQIDWRL